MLVFLVLFWIALINFVCGYDVGHSDGIREGFRSIENAAFKVRELEAELRTCRIERDILRRKYNDLMRKIKAMEGVCDGRDTD